MPKTKLQDAMAALPTENQADGIGTGPPGYFGKHKQQPGKFTVIIIPDWMPPTLNQWIYKHWRVRQKTVQDTTLMVKIHAANQHARSAQGPRKVSLLVTLGKGRKQPDRDAYDKILLDALVHCRLLVDDDDRGIVGRMAVEFDRDERSATRITLEDVT